MSAASIPASNSSSCSTAPELDRSLRGTNALDAQISSFSFPPRMFEEAQDSYLGKPDQSLIGQQSKFESVTTNTKPYRSMSIPGFFPLKRRQSNSPLRTISYTEETSSEPCAEPDQYSSGRASPNGSTSPLWSPSTSSRSSVHDSDHKISFQHLRRTSTPGTFTLKHVRHPSPLGLGGLIGQTTPSPSSSSFGGSSFFPDVTEKSHLESESNGPSRPTSNVHRTTSLDGAYFEKSGEYKTCTTTYSQIANQSRPPFPRWSRSSGSFSLKHQAKPSPLGHQLSLSVTSSPVKQLVPLQTIDDESSSSPYTQK